MIQRMRHLNSFAPPDVTQVAKASALALEGGLTTHACNCTFAYPVPTLSPLLLLDPPPITLKP